MVEIAWFLRWTTAIERRRSQSVRTIEYEKNRQVFLLDYTVDLIWYLAINLCPGKRIAAKAADRWSTTN